MRIVLDGSQWRVSGDYDEYSIAGNEDDGYTVRDEDSDNLYEGSFEECLTWIWNTI